MTIVLKGRNVNDLYSEGMKMLWTEGVREKSRAGAVLVMPTPVMSVYENPRERVLFDQRRDANPFFHLYESLWMLAGEDHTESLDWYIKDFGARFAEADGVMHGAYGYRWRQEFGTDQLDTLVFKLKENPQDRQAVLQMWDCNVCDDLYKGWKDRPCNTHCYFRIRDENPEEKDAAAGAEPWKVLDMTVLCRSNDIIFGAYGANAVHFSMLLEYMAGRIGVPVGRLYQFSNNYHAYEDVYSKMMPLVTTPYDEHMEPEPIGDIWEGKTWDNDLKTFMEWHYWLWEQNDDGDDLDTPDNIKNRWFHTVAGTMAAVHWLYKKGRRNEAMEYTQHIEASDWRAAARLWLTRRKG